MSKQSKDNILSKLDELTKNLSTSNNEDGYEKAANKLLAVNGILFITLIWKAFDPSMLLPWGAKVSLVLFAIGALFSVLRYVASYLSSKVKKTPILEEAKRFFEDNKDLIEKERPNDYLYFQLITYCIEKKQSYFERSNDKERPTLILVIFYLISEFVLLLSSAVCLLTGLAFLMITAMLM